MTDEPDELRLEIAAAAARLVAESGLDYGTAKHKAVRRLLGDRSLPRAVMPDNDDIDAALREHLDLFDPEHAARVQRRRRLAVGLMTQLASFSPYLTGAVWKGICADHAPTHLQLFHDDPKEVEIHLLNQGVRFEVSTLPHFRQPGEEVEVLLFELEREPVMLSLYPVDDLRGALRRDASGTAERGDLNQVRSLEAGSP